MRQKRTWLIEIRKMKGFTVKELADKAGISPSYLTNIEMGYRTPSGPVALRIATILGVNVELFFYNECCEKQLC